MDPERLAELEMHLAAGTDLPTALAALGDDPKPPQSQSSPAALLMGAPLPMRTLEAIIKAC